MIRSSYDNNLLFQTHIMNRTEAIDALTAAELVELSLEERIEQLEIMLCEDWSDDPEWQALPREIRQEFHDGALRFSASDCRYDAVLLLWLRGRFAAATNEFLRDQLRSSGNDVLEVVGTPAPREACPCCGARTLGQRGDYDICPVCWWEDDGQDNPQADIVMGGPNYHQSLTQARVNVLIHGISDPNRGDLRVLQHPMEMYERGRHFMFANDGRRIREQNTAWESSEFCREIDG
jgi:hypothetical protein